MPHVIRLRGPWEREERADAVRFTRRFHAPTGLDERTTVWLAIEDVPLAANVTLNGLPLGERRSHPARVDVTERLRTNNVLVIEAEAPRRGPAADPRGVRLEIEQRDGR